ncbi:MAG TPA: maleylpyruvate isomerase N-terminal domain-containing protein [Mycobacteriales bacterium]|nr:maleylpyruvate isomerase N-terminal domain-containing protein [Mycobacteriales bacterium]
MALQHDIAACGASHARLLTAVEGLSDAEVRAPSLLPGWSVGHVLTHLARNADSVVRRLVAAAEQRQVTQYEGGADGRAADIEAGAGRPAAELLRDLAEACAALDARVAVVTDEVWWSGCSPMRSSPCREGRTRRGCWRGRSAGVLRPSSPPGAEPHGAPTREVGPPPRPGGRLLWSVSPRPNAR